jgi:hypothetical protein
LAPTGFLTRKPPDQFVYRWSVGYFLVAGFYFLFSTNQTSLVAKVGLLFSPSN